jgi:hypothetical protein
MALIRNLSPVEMVSGKLARRDRVYFRSQASAGGRQIGLKRDRRKTGRMSPHRRFVCDLFAFVSRCVHVALVSHPEREQWQREFDEYRRMSLSDGSLRPFARLCDYLHHVFYNETLDLFSDSVSGDSSQTPRP